MIFFEFLPISFQMKNNDDMRLDSNKVSKSLKFCRRENRFIPFGSHVHGHLIWVKISTFYKDESTHLRDL